jgi:shikimate kinase
LDANYRDSGLSEIARMRGCRVVSGIDWLIFQAMAAFEILVGRPITYEDMKGGLTSSPSHHYASVPGLSLIGMMGTGKTTIGKKLAAELSLDVIDTDEAVKKKMGDSISRIFEKYGEKYFRTMENRMIRRISGETQKKIYALGGGAVSNPENRNIIKNHSFVIWLWADSAQILARIQGDGRPLLDVEDRREQLIKLISSRKADYARASDLVVNAGRSLKDTIRKILDEIH